MSLEYTIPVADLHDYQHGDLDQKSNFIETVGRALRDVGFFALTNHSLNADLIAKTYSETAKLFEMNESEKKSFEIAGLKGQRGYTSFGREHAKDSKAPDLKEFWHVGQELDSANPRQYLYPKNVWPEEMHEFREIMTDVYKRLEVCALQILEACAIYIGEPATLIREMAVDGNSILRLIHYPPIPAEVNPSSIRAAAHEDINLITLLIEATASGLELLDRQNNWLPVKTPKGCIIVDSGDMLQNLTNGFFKSTTHRVVNPDNSRERRYSAPFFVHARGEVRLDPLASCINKTGGKATHPTITADQYLMQRLREIGLY